jgi:hypothetical protein
MANVKGGASQESTTIDALLARDLNELTFEQRQFVFEDIHGVSKTQDENDDIIAKSLSDLQHELDKIQNKPDYDEALTRCKGFVLDPRFRLMFLRAKFFDARAAALHLVCYLRAKRKMFGDATLCRSVCYSDLDVCTRNSIASGAYQWLPNRDATGRAILCIVTPDNSTTAETFVSYCYCRSL